MRPSRYPGGAAGEEARSIVAAAFGAHRTHVINSTHPYGDFSFAEQRKVQDAGELRAGWGACQAVTPMTIIMARAQVDLLPCRHQCWKHCAKQSLQSCFVRGSSRKWK